MSRHGYPVTRPCPQCGGRMVLLATITDPAVIARILTHLGHAPREPG